MSIEAFNDEIPEWVIKFARLVPPMEIINKFNITLEDNIFDSVINRSWEMMNSKQLGNNFEEYPHNPYKIVEHREKMNNKNYFYELLHGGTMEAIRAVEYNYQTFIEYTNLIRSTTKEYYKDINITDHSTVAISTQKLIYEYEHFTLH